MLNLEGEVLTLPDNIMHGEVCPIKTQVCLNNLQVMGFRRKITRSNPAAGPLNSYTRMIQMTWQVCVSFYIEYK